jgi:hypothetical protein
MTDKLEKSLETVFHLPKISFTQEEVVDLRDQLHSRFKETDEDVNDAVLNFRIANKKRYGAGLTLPKPTRFLRESIREADKVLASRHKRELVRFSKLDPRLVSSKSKRRLGVLRSITEFAKEDGFFPGRNYLKWSPRPISKLRANHRAEYDRILLDVRQHPKKYGLKLVSGGTPSEGGK